MPKTIKVEDDETSRFLSIHAKLLDVDTMIEESTRKMVMKECWVKAFSMVNPGKTFPVKMYDESQERLLSGTFDPEVYGAISKKVMELVFDISLIPHLIF